MIMGLQITSTSSIYIVYKNTVSPIPSLGLKICFFKSTIYPSKIKCIPKIVSSTQGPQIVSLATFRYSGFASSDHISYFLLTDLGVQHLDLTLFCIFDFPTLKSDFLIVGLTFQYLDRTLFLAYLTFWRSNLTFSCKVVLPTLRFNFLLATATPLRQSCHQVLQPPSLHK